METKTATVKSVKPSGKQDAFGNWGYNVQFDNGDEGFLSSKSDQVGSMGVIVGQPFTYTIEKKVSQSGKDWFKVSKPKPEFNGFGGGAPKDPNIQNYIIAQSSISSAVAFVVGQGGGDTKDILRIADEFYKFVLSKKA